MKRPLVLDYMPSNDSISGSESAVSGLIAYLKALGEYIEYLETNLAITKL